jgi:hypothetical protein
MRNGRIIDAYTTDGQKIHIRDEDCDTFFGNNDTIDNLVALPEGVTIHDIFDDARRKAPPPSRYPANNSWYMGL